MLRGIGTKARQVDDRIFAVERREFGRGRAAEQGTDELAVPREFGDDLDADAMLGLRAAEELLAIEPVATREMREEIFLKRGQMRRRHRHIGLATPDSVDGLRLLDDELFLSSEASVLAGCGGEMTSPG